MLRIAAATLEGDIAFEQGQGEAAVDSLRQAISLQDELPYMEPPYWFVSARLDLGRVLLELDRAEEAEAVYRADLDQYPNNGWALRGLAASLSAQGKTTDEVDGHLDEAWRHADVSFAEDGTRLSRAR
jgi:tetratricopeptide (TPR) repeat protein